MSGQAAWLDVGLIALGLALSWLALEALGRGLRLLPVRRSRRASIARWLRVGGTAALLAYLVLAADWLLSRHGTELSALVVVISAALVAAAWTPLRDLLAGVFVSMGRLCAVGDHIRVGTLSGRVKALGYRVVTLETPSGDEAVVPYTLLLGGAVERTASIEGAAPHVFVVSTPADLDVEQARRAIIEGTLTCHWASLTREPEVAVSPGGKLQVTAFALDADHGLHVERAVISCLDRAVKQRSG